MVSTSRSRTIGEEKVDIATTRGHEKKGDFKGKIYKKKEASNPV
jgi:hypothetical protein